MTLAVSAEKSLFKVNITLALLFWVALVCGTFGLGLLYILAAFVFYLFAHSALIAQLKGSAVKISESQYPDLFAKINRACEKLNMPAPEAYLMNGNGAINAFATKFMRQHYIVLLSNVVDAFDKEDSAIDFYIGHELGHVHRKHLRWWPILLPVSMLPLLMPAYRRACESTCDQYGKFVTPTTDDAVRGMALLAAGNTRWKSFSPSSFTEQIKASGGFWMSFHEITASYPWLSKRVAMIQGGEAAATAFPKRSPLAWIMGLFCPGFLPGSLLPLLIIYAGFIGAAIAIPSFKAFQDKARKSAEAHQENIWKNPVNGARLELPQGFSERAANSKSDMIVGTFTVDPDLNLEQVLLEKSAGPLDFQKYVEALYAAKKEGNGGKFEMTKPVFSKVGGTEVADFSFTVDTQGVAYENNVRVWSHDSMHFWQDVSTVRKDSAATFADSNRFREFIVTNTRH